MIITDPARSSESGSATLQKTAEVCTLENIFKNKKKEKEGKGR